MNLTVKSSRAGSSSNPSRFLYPTLVFNLSRMAHTPLIYATGQFFFLVSLSPLRLPHPLACALDQASHHSIRSLWPRIPFLYRLFFPLHVHFLFSSHVSDEARDTFFFHLYVTQCPLHTSCPQYIELSLRMVQCTMSSLPCSLRIRAPA